MSSIYISIWAFNIKGGNTEIIEFEYISMTDVATTIQIYLNGIIDDLHTQLL